MRVSVENLGIGESVILGFFCGVNCFGGKGLIFCCSFVKVSVRFLRNFAGFFEVFGG